MTDDDPRSFDRITDVYERFSEIINAGLGWRSARRSGVPIRGAYWGLAHAGAGATVDRRSLARRRRIRRGQLARAAS
ncbi:MAG: hypothetical protein ACRC35_04570, partial [Angustibacter sp.]